ncbi:MAG: thiolase family protein [Clostridia bacterium]|nr:thiolase family protein [Clostridia bacterium]
MKSVVITSALRTAIGRLGGGLSTVLPEDLSSAVLRAVMEDAGLQERQSLIDEVIIGQTKQSTDAPNIARVAGLKAGIPEEVPAYTVHRQCASGLQAVLSGVWQIQAGYGELILAGGVESMSTAPYYIRNIRFGLGSGNGEVLDPNTESQPKSQPEEIYGSFTMGQTAENLAEKYQISREDQDLFAYQSQQKAIKAIDTGLFRQEIIPVTVKKKKEQVIFAEDEHPRRDTTLEKLASLKPVFKAGGTVTAGNSSGRNDGAAAVALMSEEMAGKLGLTPLARFVSAGIAGVDPRFMGIGPVPATEKALRKAGLQLKDIGLVEINEAFAAQTLAVIRELDLDAETVNVNGGAIALGHPLGCSGTRILVTLLHEMARRKVKYGLATICVAGGLGVSVIVENLTL